MYIHVYTTCTYIIILHVHTCIYYMYIHHNTTCTYIIILHVHTCIYRLQSIEDCIKSCKLVYTPLADWVLWSHLFLLQELFTQWKSSSREHIETWALHGYIADMIQLHVHGIVATSFHVCSILIPTSTC